MMKIWLTSTETDTSRSYFGKTNLLDQLNRSAEGRLEGNNSPNKYLEASGVGTKKQRSVSKYLDSPLNQIRKLRLASSITFSFPKTYGIQINTTQNKKMNLVTRMCTGSNE